MDHYSLETHHGDYLARTDTLEEARKLAKTINKASDAVVFIYLMPKDQLIDFVPEDLTRRG